MRFTSLGWQGTNGSNPQEAYTVCFVAEAWSRALLYVQYLRSPPFGDRDVVIGKIEVPLVQWGDGIVRYLHHFVISYPVKKFKHRPLSPDMC